MKYYILLFLLLFINIVNAQSKYGIIKTNGESILAIEYDEISETSEGLVAIRKGKKWGYIDTLGKVIIPFQYTEANDFSQGYVLVRKDEGRYFKYLSIDKIGKVITTFSYAEMKQYYEVLTFRKNSLWGMVDKTGKVILEAQFDRIYHARKNNALIIARKKGKYGCIDRSGKTIIPFEYDEMDYDAYNSLYIILEKDGKKGYINDKGKFIIPLAYDFIDGYGDDMIFVGKGNQWGYYNTKGKLKIRLKTDTALTNFRKKHWLTVTRENQFSDGLASTFEGKKCGFINKKGKLVLPMNYARMHPLGAFQKGFCRVTQIEVNDKGWSKYPDGIINKQGEIIIPIADYYLLTVQEYQNKPVAYLYEKENDTFIISIIDLVSKKTIMKFRNLQGLTEFYKGYAFFKKGRKYGIIDDKQQIIIPATFSSYRHIGSNLWKVAIKSKIREVNNIPPVSTGPPRTPRKKIKADKFLMAIAEQQPEFKGGKEALKKFLKDNLHYPSQARRIGIEGKVWLEFIVTKDGSLSDIKVLKGIGKGCDEEAIRLLKKMPRWIPGKQRGKAVRVRMSMPIVFKIDDK